MIPFLAAFRMAMLSSAEGSTRGSLRNNLAIVVVVVAFVTRGSAKISFEWRCYFLIVYV
jgi:hypothetical protein